LRLSRLFAVVVAAAAFAVVAPAAHADDYFLKVDGIAADEVPAANMTGYIRINDFTWGGEAERTISGTTGAGIGKATFNELTVGKFVDATSPAFLERFGLGTPLKFAEIVVRRPAASGTATSGVYLRYCFQTAFVSDVEQSGGGDEGVKESLKFAYGAAGMTYTKVDATGRPIGNVFSGWNVMTNQLQTAPAAGCSR
jgi:type VI secretion system secreted protein Hcp